MEIGSSPSLIPKLSLIENIKYFLFKESIDEKSPPASVLITKAAKIEKGSGESSKGSVGSINRAQLEEIAKTKLPDLNCTSVESAMRIIEGTARNMGVAISD